MNSDPETPKDALITPFPNLEKLVIVIGNLARWKMLRELSDGEARSTHELAKAGGCSYASALKHLSLMCDAGVAHKGRGKLYQLPKEFLSQPGNVDFGHCLLRLNVGK